MFEYDTTIWEYINYHYSAFVDRIHSHIWYANYVM